MNRDNFWNDEKVKEFLKETCGLYDIDRDIANFKASYLPSHSIGNEEWEIVSYWDIEFITDDEKSKIITKGHYYWNIAVVKDFPIHSVLRKSDSAIFSVGDEIYAGGENRKIEQIFIGPQPYNEMYVITPKNHSWNLISIQPLPQRTKLFTTEDGVDIFDGDNYCAVNNDFILSSVAKSYVGAGQDHRLKYFSTEEKAKKYITINKPCLSVNEVLRELNLGNYSHALYTLVKKKLNIEG